MPSSPKTADPLRKILSLQHAVRVGAVVCPLILAVLVLTVPGALLPSEEPTAVGAVFLLVAASLGLDSFGLAHDSATAPG
jgi:hypothetical protein